MDASCKIQGSIHSFRLVHNMCPEFWVHIITETGRFLTLSVYVPFAESDASPDKDSIDSLSVFM